MKIFLVFVFYFVSCLGIRYFLSEDPLPNLQPPIGPSSRETGSAVGFPTLIREKVRTLTPDGGEDSLKIHLEGIENYFVNLTIPRDSSPGQLLGMTSEEWREYQGAIESAKKSLAKIEEEIARTGQSSDGTRFVEVDAYPEKAKLVNDVFIEEKSFIDQDVLTQLQSNPDLTESVLRSGSRLTRYTLSRNGDTFSLTTSRKMDSGRFSPVESVTFYSHMMPGHRSRYGFALDHLLPPLVEDDEQ